MRLEDKNSQALSDEQFCEILLSRDTDSTAADACGADALKKALSGYRTETLAWAERRSATMPSLARTARRRRWLGAVSQWSLAAVAAMTIAVSVAHRSNAPQETATVETPAVASTMKAVATSQKQIADDNALLSSIDDALNAGGRVPAQSAAALGLRPGRDAAPRYGSME